MYLPNRLFGQQSSLKEQGQASLCQAELAATKHAQTQQIEVGTSTHLSFEQLEFRDLP
jgi:hypothetical protein